MTPREAPATMAGPPTARHRRRHGTGVNGSQERSEERIPSCGLNAYLRPRRSRATWGNAGPHSGYRHLADQDEAGGSSPGRPTTGLDQRERWAACPELVGRDGCRIKNAYLVTVAGYGRVAPSLRTGPLSATRQRERPRADHRRPVWSASPGRPLLRSPPQAIGSATVEGAPTVAPSGAGRTRPGPCRPPVRGVRWRRHAAPAGPCPPAWWVGRSLVTRPRR
jgi:hypothetical protein